MMRDRVRFANRATEVSPRILVAGAVLACAIALAFDQRWILVPLSDGVVTRVLAGLALTPLAMLATRVVVPRVAVQSPPPPHPEPCRAHRRPRPAHPPEPAPRSSCTRRAGGIATSFSPSARSLRAQRAQRAHRPHAR
jgi:hypothetical protein